MADFESDFKDALNSMIQKPHDDYTELQYADNIYVQVWSHDNGVGSFELYAIIPHEEVDKSLVDGSSGDSLSFEIDGVEQFYDDIDRLVEEVTGNTYPNLAFHLIEVVDDGTWATDASTFATHELEA